MRSETVLLHHVSGASSDYLPYSAGYDRYFDFCPCSHTRSSCIKVTLLPLPEEDAVMVKMVKMVLDINICYHGNLVIIDRIVKSSQG